MANGFFLRLRIFLFCYLVVVTSRAQPTWTMVATPAPDSSGSLMLLLSDGSVLCKTTYGLGDRYGNKWNKLTPDVNGSYINGNWSQVCPMKDTRLYFSSQTLKNGKIYMAGGEYGSGGGLGEIYDPATNSWKQLPPTNNYLGDACSEILPDGRILQASLSTFNKMLLFDPATNLYSNGPNSLGGHNESTWLKLPDESILMVDIGSTNSERYLPSLNQWVADANVPTNLYDPYGNETGPGFLLPDGRGFFIGSRGNTAYYTPSGNNSPGTWATGPTVPNNHGMPDAAGAMMVDGTILFIAGPKPVSTNSIFVAPTYFYEFNYLTNTFTQVGAPGGGSSIADTAFNCNLLNLPDGSIMYSRYATKNYYIHQPNGSPLAAGKPTITSVSQNSCTQTCTLTGLLFNGICEGSCYGDDWQMNTNYPIVRLTSGANVYYARSHHWNRTGIRTGTLPDTTLFDLPQNIPAGTYSLSVSANGNSSDPVTFSVSSFPSLASTLFPPDLCSGSTFTYNAIASLTNTTMMWTRAAVLGLTNTAITNPQSSSPNEVLVNSGSVSRTAVYSYTLMNGACNTNYSVCVVVHPEGAINISGNTSICEGNASTITAKGITSFSWSTGANTNSIVLSPTANTVVSVSGIDYNGCLAYRQFSVTLRATPILTVDGDSLICVGESAHLIAGGNGNSYLWNTGAVGFSIVVTPTTTSMYTVTSFAENGCTAKKSVTVKVEICESIGDLAVSRDFVNIYPNPFTGKMDVLMLLQNKETIQITLRDVSGRVMFQDTGNFSVGSNTYLLQTGQITPGIYFLELKGTTFGFTTRVVKE